MQWLDTDTIMAVLSCAEFIVLFNKEGKGWGQGQITVIYLLKLLPPLNLQLKGAVIVAGGGSLLALDVLSDYRLYFLESSSTGQCVRVYFTQQQQQW